MKISFVALATLYRDRGQRRCGGIARSTSGRAWTHLPAPTTAIANYVPAVRTGNLVFLAGQIARGPDGKFLVGKVGREVTEADATAAARTLWCNFWPRSRSRSAICASCKRIVRVGGFVNCTDTFTNQPKVINGCSDLLVAVFRRPGPPCPGGGGRRQRTSSRGPG